MFKFWIKPLALSTLVVVSTASTTLAFSKNFDPVIKTRIIGERSPSLEVASAYFEVMYDVPLISQQTDMSCWAAGAAMLVAWRDRIHVDPSSIAKATGYWRQYREGLGADNTGIFPLFGMVAEPAQTYSVKGFKQLLETYGPLWVASAEPGSHIRVVRGIQGDGTPNGTYVYINDPWEKGMKRFRSSNRGSQYWETYAEFVKKQETLARRELNVQGIYVAHLRK